MDGGKASLCGAGGEVDGRGRGARGIGRRRGWGDREKDGGDGEIIGGRRGVGREEREAGEKEGERQRERGIGKRRVREFRRPEWQIQNRGKEVPNTTADISPSQRCWHLGRAPGAEECTPLCHGHRPRAGVWFHPVRRATSPVNL